MQAHNSAKDYLFLYTGFLIYSGSSILNKLSSRYDLFSLPFILCYAGAVAILGIYAILWQRILKRFDLVTAYANRPVITLLSMLWGVLLFQEAFTWNMAAGAALLLAGIRLVVTDHAD